MPQDSLKPWKDFAAGLGNEHDSKKIGDLIEQLNHDLDETEKSASRRQREEQKLRFAAYT
jgi:hypothetical protein